MTHDELLAKIDKQDHAIKIGGIGSEIEVLRLMGFRKTLRAVVELHKPENATLQSWFKLFNNKTVIGCRLCNDFYPCPTIQAIEKELA